MTAEHVIIKVIKGYKKPEWQKTRERNEALDLKVYNLAAAIIVGIDRFKDKHWDRLKGQSAQQAPVAPKKQDQKKATSKKPLKRRKSSWL